MIDQQTALTPVVYQYSCPYCKRGFEIDGVKAWKAPKQMICRDCSDAYRQKVIGSFKLEQEHVDCARRVAGINKDSRERKEIVARWNQLLERTKDVHIECHWRAMLDVVRKCDVGLMQPLAPSKSKNKEEW